MNPIINFKRVNASGPHGWSGIPTPHVLTPRRLYPTYVAPAPSGLVVYRGPYGGGYNPTGVSGAKR